MSEEQDSENQLDRIDYLKRHLLTQLAIIQPVSRLALESIETRDGKKLKEVVNYLLQMAFGNDVNAGNISARFEKVRCTLEKHLIDSTGNPLPGKNSVVEGHLLFAQRILVARIGSYVRYLERRWLDEWLIDSPTNFDNLYNFHNVLKNYSFYTTIYPAVVELRRYTYRHSFSSEGNLNASLEYLLQGFPGATATITIDLLQPKENLMVAFERLIDKAKSEMREHPENQMMLNLYDFTREREKKCRRNKPPYKDWHRAILDYEDSSEYCSFHQAGKDLAQENEKFESVARSLGNRSKRYFQMFNAVMNDTFPALD